VNRALDARATASVSPEILRLNWKTSVSMSRFVRIRHRGYFCGMASEEPVL
jgi:hypothetical protein